jgi:hypothetical protein
MDVDGEGPTLAHLRVGSDPDTPKRGVRLFPLTIAFGTFCKDRFVRDASSQSASSYVKRCDDERLLSPRS